MYAHTRISSDIDLHDTFTTNQPSVTREKVTPKPAHDHRINRHQQRCMHIRANYASVQCMLSAIHRYGLITQFATTYTSILHLITPIHVTCAHANTPVSVSL